jgi:CAAX protease family protein
VSHGGLAAEHAAGTARRARWTAGRIAALASGSLLFLVGLCLFGAAGVGLWADLAQRDGGYATSDVHHFSTSGSALASEPTRLGTSGFARLYSPGILGKVRIRVTPAGAASPLFVGIGPSRDVDRYLAGVEHAVISDFWSRETETVPGERPRSPPARQRFWVASSSGTGTRSVVWKPSKGSWTAVVMAADGRAGLDVGADLGARIPALLWVSLGVLAAGAILVAGGGLLIGAVLRAGAVSRGVISPSPEGGAMATSIAATAPQVVAGHEEDVRYQGIRQYSVAQILGVWAAAAVPMAVLAWVVAPILEDHLSGAGHVPMLKALVLCLTAGMIWEFVLVALLVWHEQRSLRWSVVRDALWLHSPRSPKTERVGGRLWLVVIPLIVLTAIEQLLPVAGVPANRDLGKVLDSHAAHVFLSGNWGWFSLIVLMFVFNTALGEELLFRGLLLPRMKRAFGRGDWAANGVLFAAYHVHVPWVIPGTLVFDTAALAYPSRRYQSAWIGIVVHSAQTVFLTAVVLALVL